MKKNKIKNLFCFLTGLSLIIGCSKENNSDYSTPGNESGSKGLSDMISLGEHYNDPYKIDNMQQALSDILAQDPDFPIKQITANEKYIRFLPKNFEEDSVLESYSDVTFFDFPLDYELSDEGCYYHDPTVSDSVLTWQYCVVPINYEFNNTIEYEHLYDVFIPDLDCTLGDYYLQIEEKAYRLAGYPQDSTSGSKASKWKPSVTIRVYDDVLGRYTPLANAKIIVKGKHGSKKGEATTNSQGQCTIDKSFSSSKELRYFIKWETGRFNLRHGVLGQAWSKSSLMSTAWNYDMYANMPQNPKDYVYANVHRGAYKFFYGNILGLKNPKMTRKTHIGVIDENGTSFCTGLRMLGMSADIVVKKKHSNDAFDIISNTLHEIAHQSHLLFMSRRLYIGIKKVVYESWASAVEWKLTTHFYEELGTSINYNHEQDWEPNSFSNGRTSCYTPLFIDLMDTYNQYHPINNSNRPNDIISGYTISYIQDSILPSSYGLSSTYSSIINHKITGVTNAMIDTLFTLYWGQDFDWHN